MIYEWMRCQLCYWARDLRRAVALGTSSYEVVNSASRSGPLGGAAPYRRWPSPTPINSRCRNTKLFRRLGGNTKQGSVESQEAGFLSGPLAIRYAISLYAPIKVPRNRGEEDECLKHMGEDNTCPVVPDPPQLTAFANGTQIHLLKISTESVCGCLLKTWRRTAS
ncbi:hypothetical protein BGW80DRAFT_1332471 [Lactifluus volemus]|nr:hypothetical protein BGW80DRAFT_1332471 [Lactifluus volemus]